MTKSQEASPPSTSLPEKTTAERISIQSLFKELERDGFKNPSALAVIGVVSNEQFIGEVEGEPPDIVGKRLVLRNPKRFLRLQVMHEDQKIAVQFVIGPLDMVEGGFIQVFPAYAYYLKNLEVQSQGAMLELLVEYERKKRAAESGLIVPEHPGIIRSRE
jgi:hypothetical protein